MKYFVILSFLLFLPVIACAEPYLVSDPSATADLWKVELSNGTVYNGETDEGRLYWDMGQLSAGQYNGTAYFGISDGWVLQENDTLSVWSNGTEFDLKRKEQPRDENLKLKEVIR
mgnify:CR=1 FL=1